MILACIQSYQIEKLICSIGLNTLFTEKLDPNKEQDQVQVFFLDRLEPKDVAHLTTLRNWNELILDQKSYPETKHGYFTHARMVSDFVWWS